jgi:hypothetical protein
MVMSSTFQIEQIKIEAVLTKYKTLNEKTAFLDGYKACLEKEKRILEEEKRKMESEDDI